ncbi:hypothetical protein BGX30_007312 [Mortierella sp. GBA39]|nr:hypothetical protein BGX30_007312 [Mortierella sp. GBA39]
MAFMRGGNYLYVQGGKLVTNEVQISISNQLAALDLSKSWSASAPVWNILNPGPPYNLYNGVSTADNQTLITFYNNQELFVNIYNVQSNNWQYTSAKPSGELLQAIRTVIDPKTGLIYINGASNMIVFNPANRGEDGNTMVMFGGRTPPPGNFTGTFYILDVPSKIWVQGPSASTRLYSACAIVGDQLVVWGGFDGKSTIDGPPIIYSFSQKKWVEQYTPPAYFASSTGNNPSSSSSSNLGGILGGTLGSLCVLALAGVVYLYMKRRGDKAMYESQAQQRIIRQAERTNKPSGGGEDGSVAESAKFMRSGDPQNAAAMAADINGNTSARNPQDVVAMGFYFEPHNRQDPQLLPMSPLNTPMGPGFQQQQFKPPVFVPTSGSLTPTIFDPSTINYIQGGGPVAGYTTIPVQTTVGLAYMSVPVQSTPPCPGTVRVGSTGYGYTSNNGGGYAYTPVPLQSPTGQYLQPAGVSGGTPSMGYAGFSPVQGSDHDSSPGSVHRPLVVSGSSGGGTAGYSYPGTPVTSSGGGSGDYY